MSILYTVSNMNSLHTVSEVDTIGSMATFGERLRELRKSKGISQERLAEMIDYQRTNLVNIELGKKKASEEVLKKLADVKELGVPLELLKAWQMIDAFGPETILAAAAELYPDDLAEAKRRLKEKE